MGSNGIDCSRHCVNLLRSSLRSLARWNGCAVGIFAHYLALVKTAHTEVAVPRRRDGWLQRLDDDNDNLRTALSWGSERDPRGALRMAVDLSWYWWYRRRYPEGVGWQERLLDRAADDTRLRARALAHVGLLAREYGDLARAQVALSEAKVRFDALGD